jgi:ATP-dependent RNA helicase DeaD
MTTFADLGLSELACAAVAELGYEEPTPVQAQVIQLLLDGRDVVAQAQTGTGKTAAFALPIIDQLSMEQVRGRPPQALVMTPTRELAVQVAEAFHAYGRSRGVIALPVYGGQPIERQLGALRRGVEVVVGTPGRLLDHMRRATLDLSAVRTVVLDEADEMFAMGFIEDIEAILVATPAERQLALFSATMPDAVARLAERHLRDPRRVMVRTEAMTVPQVRQVHYEVGGRDKFEVLARVLDYEAPASAIIFCRTKREVDELGERLVGRAYPAETLHGDLSQMQRDRVMQRFRAGQVELLVATDVAARGLDVQHVSHVVNYDIPQDPESYVHRIGRTGRAGRAGCAITLVTPRERRQLQFIQRTIGAEIPRQHVPTIADVLGRRREAFKEALRETMAAGGLESYVLLAETLGEDCDPTELAAAAFKLLLGEQEVAEDELAAQEPRVAPAGARSPRPADDGSRGRRPRGAPPTRPPGGFGPDRGMTRLFLNIGREDGARPADLVGAIANEAGLPGRAIGAIDMYDRFAFVEVPAAEAEAVLRALGRTTIRGRRVKASVAFPER